MRCSVLQCVAVCCSALQCVAVCYLLPYEGICKKTLEEGKCAAACYSVIQMCCSVLQCVAVCCSVLQCIAVCCSVLQWVAVCCLLFYKGIRKIVFEEDRYVCLDACM